MYIYFCIEQTQANARHHGSTGTGTASQRFTGTALIDPQADVMAINNLHEPGVDMLGKTHMAFNQRPDLRDSGGVNICHQQHRMGISHRQHGDMIRYQLNSK